MTAIVPAIPFFFPVPQSTSGQPVTGKIIGCRNAEVASMRHLLKIKKSCATLGAFMVDAKNEEGTTSDEGRSEFLRVFHGEATEKEKKRAFETLYRANAQIVFQRVLMPVLHDETLAEEALSITFRKVSDKLCTFEERGVSLSAWIARIAKNTAIDLLRRENRIIGRHASFASAVTTMVADLETPETRILSVDEKRAQRAQIEKTLAGLHERYAETIRMRFLEEKSRAACAEALGVKLATFDVILLRSLRAFRKQWGASTQASTSEQHG